MRSALVLVLTLALGLTRTSLLSAGTCDGMRLSGVIDGPLTGGTPKAVEIYVTENIADLSVWGLGSANNGGGSGGQEFIFPAGPAIAGDFLFVATEATQFTNFFGFAPDYVNATAANINGDDAVELFCSGNVVDTFGDINVDGTGQPWEYTDGWAYRVDNTGPDGTTFVLANWFFSGIDALDGAVSNANAIFPFPNGTLLVPAELVFADGFESGVTSASSATSLESLSIE